MFMLGNARTPGLTQAFIATLADGSGYALLLDGKVVSTRATVADRSFQAKEIGTSVRIFYP